MNVHLKWFVGVEKLGKISWEYIHHGIARGIFDLIVSTNRCVHRSLVFLDLIEKFPDAKRGKRNPHPRKYPACGQFTRHGALCSSVKRQIEG